MKVSASIELIVHLASQEAMAAEFEQIEPEHLLAALLKFAELPVEEVDKIGREAEPVRQLASEVLSMREQLAARHIDSTRVRRQLRGALGRGGRPFDGRVMHRSARCREIFDLAGRLADEAGAEVLIALHLLMAVLGSPTPLIADTLGDALKQPVDRLSCTPLLDERGRDLTRLAGEGKLPTDTRYDAAGRALIRCLSQAACTRVFLVTDSNVAAETVAGQAAQIIVAKNCPSSLRSKRLVDISGIHEAGTGTSEVSDLVEKLVSEATAAGNTILLGPPIETMTGPIETMTGTSQHRNWLALLRGTLERGSLACLCRVGPGAYARMTAKDRHWRRLAHALWIEQIGKSEVPWQL